MTSPAWRKSSYSTGGTSGECVELAAFGAEIGIRDSKAPGAGHLTVSGASFLACLKVWTMTTPPVWRKSSYSTDGTSGECVEMASFGAMIGLRDSKAPDAGHLALPAAAFADLVARVKRDELSI